jgi:hypothetical protein
MPPKAKGGAEGIAEWPGEGELPSRPTAGDFKQSKLVAQDAQPCIAQRQCLAIGRQGQGKRLRHVEARSRRFVTGGRRRRTENLPERLTGDHVPGKGPAIQARRDQVPAVRQERQPRDAAHGVPLQAVAALAGSHVVNVDGAVRPARRQELAIAAERQPGLAHRQQSADARNSFCGRCFTQA